MVKIDQKFFSTRQFMHQSKALVELIRNMLFLEKNFNNFWPKKPKNSDK
jgi:hypothetical protein